MLLALFETNPILYTNWKRRGADRYLRWIAAENGHVPDGAVEAGRLGGRDGDIMYVGRVCLPNDDTLPGTVIPSRKACFAAWRGAELEAETYEVLVNTKPDQCYLHWSSPSSDGEIPHNAVRGGFDATTSELIYIARLRPPGTVGTHAGQVRAGETMASVSYGAAEHHLDNFKILCRRFVHKYSNNYRPYTC